MKPVKSIVPILGLDKSKQTKEFLGTGSFCGDPCYLVTADHVIRDWQGDFYIVIRDESSKFYNARVVIRKPQADLALLKVEDYEPSYSLPLAKEGEIVPNKVIFSYEYGTTITIAKQIQLSPATRMGNVTRILNMQDQYGLAGEGILELSFPALKGASGSPVIDIKNRYSLWGIIIANAQYHLLPSQIESILNQNGKVEEEIKYILPQALAVNVRHLRELMKDVNKE